MTKLRKIRIGFGERQSDVARKARLTQAAISYIEQGGPASVPTQRRIAQALGVSVKALL